MTAAAKPGAPPAVPTPPAPPPPVPPTAEREYLDRDWSERKPMPTLEVWLPGRQRWGKFQALTSRELEEINELHREQVVINETTGETKSQINQKMYTERILARAARKKDGSRVVVGEINPGVLMFAEELADSWIPGDIITAGDALFDAMGLGKAAVARLGKG